MAQSNQTSKHGTPLENIIEHIDSLFSDGPEHPQVVLYRHEWKLLKRALEAKQVETPAVQELQRQLKEAREIMDHNLALANRTSRNVMNERNAIIRKMRETYSAIEIADMVGLTRQRVHQILNEAPVESVEKTEAKLCLHSGESLATSFTSAAQGYPARDDES